MENSRSIGALQDKHFLRMALKAYKKLGAYFEINTARTGFVPAEIVPTQGRTRAATQMILSFSSTSTNPAADQRVFVVTALAQIESLTFNALPHRPTSAHTRKRTCALHVSPSPQFPDSVHTSAKLIPISSRPTDKTHGVQSLQRERS